MMKVMLTTLLAAATISNSLAQGIVNDIWDTAKVNIIKNGELVRGANGEVFQIEKPKIEREEDDSFILERMLPELKVSKINVIDEEDFNYQVNYLKEDIQYLKERCERNPEKCIQRIKRTLFVEGEGAGKNLISISTDNNLYLLPQVSTKGELNFSYDLSGSVWGWLKQKDGTLTPLTANVISQSGDGSLQQAYVKVVNFGQLDSGAIELNAIHTTDLIDGRLSEIEVTEHVKRYTYNSKWDHQELLKRVVSLGQVNEQKAFDQLKSFRRVFGDLKSLEENEKVFEVIIEALSIGKNLEVLGKDIISERVVSGGFTEVKPLKIITKTKIGKMK